MTSPPAIPEPSNRELLELLGKMKVAVFRTAPDSRLRSLNAAGAEILGAASPAELLGRRFADFYVDPGDRKRVRELLAAKGRATGFRMRVRRLDGQVIWIETNILARRDAQGEFLELEGFAREIGELVAAEEQVRQLDQLLNAIIDGANLMVVAVDLRARVLIWNQAAEQITGYSREEAVGSATIWDRLYSEPGDWEWARAKAFEILQSKEEDVQHDFESTIVNKNGERRLLTWSARTLSDPQGVRIGGVSLARDVTEERDLQRRAQQQESERRAELERLVRERTVELEAANRELQRLDQMKARFLANISHELRTPLVSGLGYVNLILEGALGPVNRKQRKGLGISRQNLQRLAALIDDLLAFTQHDPSARKPQPQPFDLRQLIRECFQDLAANLRPGVRLQMQVEEELPPVLADREQIRRALVNLLTNAEKFTGEQALIEVQARRTSPAQVEVHVCDDGIGIPEDERDRVFEHLYRSSRTDPSVYRGTGIGLFLVREILRAHGSEVRAEGREGPGTDIVFYLPLQVDSASSTSI